MQYYYDVKIYHLYWKKNTTLYRKPQKMCLKNQYNKQCNKDSNFVEIS